MDHVEVFNSEVFLYISIDDVKPPEGTATYKSLLFAELRMLVAITVPVTVILDDGGAVGFIMSILTMDPAVETNNAFRGASTSRLEADISPAAFHNEVNGGNKEKAVTEFPELLEMRTIFNVGTTSTSVGIEERLIEVNSDPEERSTTATMFEVR